MFNNLNASRSGLTAAEMLQLEIANDRAAEAATDEDFERFRDERLSNQVKDIKNRIELRRMLAEYEAGYLQPPEYNTYNKEVENVRVSDYALDELVPSQYEQQPHLGQLVPLKKNNWVSNYEVRFWCLIHDN